MDQAPLTQTDQDQPALLCWEGSESAERAVQAAAGILGPSHPAIVLFVHLSTESAPGVLGGLSGPDAPVMGPADAEDVLERGLSVAHTAGFTARGLRVAADRKTAEIITATADEQDAAVIVMGQRKRSGLGTLLLGSVAREVLGSHDRPVLLVGPGPPGVYPRGSSAR